MTSYRLIIGAFVAGFIASFVGGSAGIIMSSPYTNERTETLFVYDTLLNPITRTYACYCSTTVKPATLSGYAKTIRNLIPAKQSQVTGGLIKVSTQELARLDQYESVPHRYHRVRVTVQNRPAWVYIKSESSRSEQ